MKIEITQHAKDRMQEYKVSEDLVKDIIHKPDNVVEGRDGRKIYQKRLNSYILRVIVEENKEIKRVITVYKSRSERYEI